MDPGRARRLRIARQPELVHHLLDDERDRTHVGERVPLARVEVDQEVVRPLDVAHARVPGVEVDAAEVDHPRQRGGVAHDREVSAVAARELDVDLADVVGMVRRDALLVERIAADAVGPAQHVERPVAQVR